jgi:hypothetical protein
MRPLLLLLATLLATLTASAQLPSYVPTDGLIAFYPFNGNANDASVNGQNGSMSNVTFTTGASGEANEAAHFNGDAQVLIPHNSLWNASSYTLTALYRWQNNPSATPNGNSLLMSKREPSGWGSSFEHSPGGGLSWTIGSNGGAGISTAIPQNTWVHITWVFTPSTIQFYLDGQLANTASSPGAMNSNSLPVSIGMRGNGWHELIGDIDHIGYWSRALSESEVLDLHAMEVTPTEGCTDPTACNYDSAAEVDDGSCIAPCIQGCTDSGACNYNAEANSDDGSCLFVDLTTSYEDNLCAGEEFEVSAQFSISPGSTEWTVIGNQTKSFGSAWSINWNLTEGHTYRLQVSGTYRIWNQGCVDFEYWCDHNHGGYPGLPHSGCPPNITHSLGCSIEPDSDVFNSTDHTYEYTFVASSSSLTIEFTDCCYGDNAGALSFQLLEPDFNPNASNVIWSNGNTGLSASYALMQQGWASVTYSSDLGICADSVLVDVLTVGCLDASACNFDSNAGCDSGLCTYPGCTDSEACNFNAEAGCDDGSCVYPPLVELGTNTTLCDGQTLDLSVDAPGLTTTWSTGATGPAISVTETGTYSVQSGGEFGADYRLEFDGVDDYVSFGSSLDITTFPFSIQADVTVPSDYWPILDTDDGTDGYSGIWYAIGPDLVEISVGEGSGGGPNNRRSKIGSHGLQAGTVATVSAVVRGATDMSLYVNGVDIGGNHSGSGNTTFIDNGLDAVTARYTPSSGSGLNILHYYDGTLDNLHVWAKALTATEVAQFLDTPAEGSEDGLLAVYTFDEGAGTTSTDGANGVEAQLFGNPTWVLEEAGCSASDTITVHVIDCETLCGPGTTWDPILQSCIAEVPEANAAEDCSLFTLQELSTGYLNQQQQMDALDTLVVTQQAAIDSLNALLNNCTGND